MEKSKSLQCAILGLFLYLAQNILSGLLVGTFNMENNVSQFIGYLFTLFVAVLLIRNKERAVYFGLRPIKTKRKNLWCLPLIVIPIINLFYLFLPEREISQGIVIGVISGIYVGVMEELIFRSFLFRAIEEKLNSKQAIIISSIVFGLFHLVNLSSLSTEIVVLQVIYATAIGVCLSIVFQITQSLLPCIAIHALTDITGFLFAENMQFMIEFIGMIMIIIVAVLYSFLYNKHTKILERSK